MERLHCLVTKSSSAFDENGLYDSGLDGKFMETIGELVHGMVLLGMDDGFPCLADRQRLKAPADRRSKQRQKLRRLNNGKQQRKGKEKNDCAASSPLRGTQQWVTNSAKKDSVSSGGGRRTLLQDVQTWLHKAKLRLAAAEKKKRECTGSPDSYRAAQHTIRKNRNWTRWISNDQIVLQGVRNEGAPAWACWAFLLATRERKKFYFFFESQF